MSCDKCSEGDSPRRRVNSLRQRPIAGQGQARRLTFLPRPAIKSINKESP
jgi:hypothetical protein